MTMKTDPSLSRGTDLFVGLPDFTQGTDRAALVLNPIRTGPFRPVDFSVVPTDRFSSLHLHLSDEVVIYLSGNAPSEPGPPPHSHSVDQYFYILEGEIELVLGTLTHRLRAGDWAFIPAGVEHKHRNLSSTSRELHLEVMAPGFDMSVPFMIWAGRPESWRSGGTVIPMPPLEEWRITGTGSRMHVLSEVSGALDPAAPDSKNISTWLVHTEAGAAPHPTMHVHAFSQFFYVTEGTLGVEVGLEQFEAGPHTLVAIPRGVPHRNYVVGDHPEAHIQINVPPPHQSSMVDRWDVPVEFRPSAP
jgi:mannose-6-phosphate isomerase-like protein (cupin superfamily)